MMAGLLIWTEVVCAGCSTTICGEYARWGKRVAAEIKTELANAGWKVVGSDAHCPDCLASIKAHQASEAIHGRG